MFVRLLWELRRHGVGHQRRGRALVLLESEGCVVAPVLRTFRRSKLLLRLEAVLRTEVSLLVVEAGLSVAIVARRAVAVAVASPIASVLGV